MKKKYRDIVVDGEDYAWMTKGPSVTIWKDKKVIFNSQQEHWDHRDEEDRDVDDERYTNDESITPRMIAALIRAKSYKERAEIMRFGTQSPYIMEEETITHKRYNPYYGLERICECGHTYDRHFDSYEDMDAVGCKYCDCFTFKEKKATKR